MLPLHERMAELWTIQKKRELSEEEDRELQLCLEANAGWVWKRIKLKNMSLLASMTKDHEWHHEICRRLEQLDAAGDSS